MPVSSGSVVSVVFNAIFLDATIFGFFKVKFGQCIFLMPLSSVFWRQFCSGQFFCWIDHRVFQFFGVSFVRGIFFRCHYLRILWCSFCTRQFCWCHYLRFFGVNFVQGMSFLMPLSSEKLVSFFVQGAFCDATIFGFLMLNVSMSRSF